MRFDHYLRRVMSGTERGCAAGALRFVLATAEPIYSSVARHRNRGYDRHPEKAKRLPRPVISIGNLTAGGTGKTPIVRWLATRLSQQGSAVGILARGYKADPGTLGDEQRMLERLLNDETAAPVTIKADPDRFAAGEAALRQSPTIDVFLLDDGFQHRRLARDMNIVLVNATQPFGFGRVLPRGLLREPLEGFARAHAVILTHASSVARVARTRICDEVRKHHPGVPIYRCDHIPIGLRSGSSSAAGRDRPIEALRDRRAFAFCGIGDPTHFERAVRSAAGSYGGHHWFADHHDYIADDLAKVRALARSSAADVIVTTEKDWTKLSQIPQSDNSSIPIWRLDVAVQFWEQDQSCLLEQIARAIQTRR